MLTKENLNKLYTQCGSTNDKSATSWRGQKSVVSVQLCCGVSFPKFHYNDLLQLPRLRGSYGETSLMDFGHNGNGRARVVALYIQYILAGVRRY